MGDKDLKETMEREEKEEMRGGEKAKSGKGRRRIIKTEEEKLWKEK